jgi:hypothetical protein
MTLQSDGQGQCISDDPDCPCCDHAYDAGRTRATITLMKRVTMPHDWSVKEARKIPLSQQWHVDHFLPLNSQIRGLTKSEAENYPLRQAALAAAVIEHAPWSERTRFGAAWGLIRVGMRYHGWVASSNPEAAQLLLPEPDFFIQQSGMMELSGIITKAYVHSGGETSPAAFDVLLGQ